MYVCNKQMDKLFIHSYGDNYIYIYKRRGALQLKVLIIEYLITIKREMIIIFQRITNTMQQLFKLLTIIKILQ